MQLAGIIFDCDGTLADTMPAHYEAWAATARRYGLTLSEDRFYALGGWPTIKVAELLIQESGQDLDPASVGHEKEALFETMLHLTQPIEPVAAAVREFRGRLPIAVATGATREICLKILRQIGFADAFQAIVTSEDVARHKPAPDIFLEAARLLGVDPSRCRVYEDTDPGVAAARSAGMQCVDVRTFYMPRRVTPPQ